MRDSIEIEFTSSLERLRGAVDVWRDLARTTAEANIFYEPELLLPALEHWGKRGGVKTALAWRRPRDRAGSDAPRTLIGLAPLTRGVSKRAPLPHWRNWIYAHCYCGAPLIRAGWETAFFEALLPALSRASAVESFLSLAALPGDSVATEALRTVSQARRRRLNEFDGYDRAVVSTGLDGEGYAATTFSAKFRRNIQRSRKQIAKLGAVASRQSDAPETIREWVEAFLALEAKGWKGENGTAMACNPADADFFRRAVNACAEQGRARFFRIDLDDAPIAMTVNLVGAGGVEPTIYSLKIAYDQAHAKSGPGVVAIVDTLLDALDRPEHGFVDSCAVPGGPADKIFGERRPYTSVRVGLDGAPRRLAFGVLLGSRDLIKGLRERRAPQPVDPAEAGAGP